MSIDFAQKLTVSLRSLTHQLVVFVVGSKECLVLLGFSCLAVEYSGAEIHVFLRTTSHCLCPSMKVFSGRSRFIRGTGSGKNNF